jgi:hypothetical protein
LWQIQTRESTEQFSRGRMERMKLLDQYEAACKVRREAKNVETTMSYTHVMTKPGLGVHSPFDGLLFNRARQSRAWS